MICMLKSSSEVRSNWLQPTGPLGYWYVSMAAAAAKSKAFEKFACEVAVLASRDGIKRSNKATF